jgi:hypothetical protein
MKSSAYREALKVTWSAEGEALRAAAAVCTSECESDLMCGEVGNSEEANRMMGELAAANAAIQSSLDTDLELGAFLD